MTNIVVSALATWNGKALKKGKQDISAFDKQVSKLGKTFAGTFSAAAILSFSKKAINAFAADEKAAKALETQLKNTGNQFAAPAVEMYIANLQKTTGVLDYQLRPAFQSLLTVTKSVELSQYGLNTALEVSAGTGLSLGQVADALAKGFAGQTKALKTLVPGLDEAAVKSGDMQKILTQLNKMFAGQTTARLSTYAGKMSLLAAAASNSTEIIGKGLVDALTAISKDDTIANLATSMENLATNTAYVIVEFGKLIGKFTELTSNPSFKAGLLALALLTKNPKIIIGVMGYVGGSAALDLATKDYGPSGNSSNFTYGLGPSATKDIARAAIILAGNKARAKELQLIKEKNALEALKMKYDVERVGLMLALNNATDEETRLRIAEKLAILDGNAAKAKEYIEIGNATTLRLAEIDSLKALTAAQYLAATQMTKLADYAAYRAGERASAATLAMASAAGGAVAAGGMTFTPAPTMTMASDYAAYRAGERGDVIVNVAGSVLTDQDLTDTIQRTILQINKQGRGTTPAGGLSGGT
jgi:hypothetical protein